MFLSYEQFPEDNKYRFLVIIYLHILQNGLEKLTEENFDSGKRRNIWHTLNYLKK